MKPDDKEFLDSRDERELHELLEYIDTELKRRSDDSGTPAPVWDGEDEEILFSAGKPAVPAEPEAPAEPAVPAEPEAPTEPAAPTEPTVPAEPEAPTEPAAPAEPEAPDEPEAPAEPAVPTEPETPAQPDEAPQPEKPERVSLGQAAAEPAAVEDVDDLPPPAKRKNPFKAIWESFKLNIPAKGDSTPAILRKCAFLLALVVFIGSVAYIIDDVFVIPAKNDKVYEELQNTYEPENSEVIKDNPNYPEGMLANLQPAYDVNPEVRGWITYNANHGSDFMNINLPIAFSGDNEKYLTTNFKGETGRAGKPGALFFDKRSQLEKPEDRNKMLIVYGHNMASGQMFAHLNRLIGSEYYPRAAAHFYLSTLYERSEYQVFCAMLYDEEETGKWRFPISRTAFSSDEDFLKHVQALKDRSMFDYPVEVKADDELVMLMTCTNKSTSKLHDGRMIVVARKMREGEQETNVTRITKNEDVIMPRSWYANQGLDMHPYYGDDYTGITTTLPTDTTGTGSETGEVTGTTAESGDTTGTTIAPVVPGTTHGDGTTAGTTAPDSTTGPGSDTEPTQSGATGTGSDSQTTGSDTAATESGSEGQTTGSGSDAQTTEEGSGTTADETGSDPTSSDTTQPSDGTTSGEPEKTEPEKTDPVQTDPSDTDPAKTEPVEGDPTQTGDEPAAA